MSTLDELTLPKIDQTGPTESEEFTYVDISSVDNKTKRIVGPKRLPVTDAPSRARQRLKTGDVLVSMTRPNLNAVAIVPPELDGSIGSTGFHVLRAKDDVDARWLFNAVQSRGFIETMEGFVQGALYPAVRPKDIRGFELHVPPLQEQRRILDKIEKQFSRLDEAVANLQRVKANLKRYKASVLKDAVEGRLVPTEGELARREGRSFETGEQLLQRILEERRNNWNGRGKFKKPDAPVTMGLSELPSGWVWASVEQLADVISGLTKNPSRETLPLKLPYLRVANVYANELRLDDMAEIGVADNELQKLLVLKNDLLVVEGNGSPDQIGRVAKWDGSIAPCVHQNHLIKVRAVVAKPDWMLNWLISPGGRKQIELVSSSTTGLHTLSSGKVARLPIPLPPVAEQKRIVLEIDRRLSLIRGVEFEVDANLKRAQALRQSTLSKFFSISS